MGRGQRMGEKYWGKGSVAILILMRAVKVSLMDKMMFEQNLKEIRVLAIQISEKRVHEGVGTLTAKAQRWKCV